MEEKIRITTEKLKEKSGEWEELAKQAEIMLLSAKEEMERMEDCFAAEAVSVLQKAFYHQAQMGVKQIRLVKTQIRKLVSMAICYEEAEAANEDIIPKD